MLMSHGDGLQITFGSKIYKKDCQSCHGEYAEGEKARDYPLLQGQHYPYLLRQIQWLKNGRRQNGNMEMRQIISAMSLLEMKAVADYISRVEPNKSKLAVSKDWKNPDFDINFISAPWQLHNKEKKEEVNK